MEYREILPLPPLRGFVECFWTLEGDTSLQALQPERLLPDGCVELILNFGAEFLQHSDGVRKLQPRNFLVGQMTGPILISPTGRVELLGIRFHPGGTRPFLRVPLHEITDQVVELGSVSSKLEGDLLRVCSEPRSLRNKVAAADAYLCSSLISADYDSRLTALAGSIVER